MTNHGVSFVCFLVALLWSTFAYAHDSRGTPEQRAACTRDAFRLCASDIPDATRVESCLRRKRPDLSPACRSAFERSVNALARAK
jgi:hypothetical protein